MANTDDGETHLVEKASHHAGAEAACYFEGANRLGSGIVMMAESGWLLTSEQYDALAVTSAQEYSPRTMRDPEAVADLEPPRLARHAFSSLNGRVGIDPFRNRWRLTESVSQ